MIVSNEMSRMKVMGIAGAVYEALNYQPNHLEDCDSISGFTLRLEQVSTSADGDVVATFGMIVKDGFGDGYAADYEMPADFSFTCGNHSFSDELGHVARQFEQHTDMIRSCYEGDGWGDALAHELEAAAGLLSLGFLWNDGEAVWAARGDDMSERGAVDLIEISKRMSSLFPVA